MCCVAVRRQYLWGALGGKVSLPGVVAAYGWSRSRWFNADHRGLRWDEMVPGLPYCLPISGWPPWGLYHVCTAVCGRISAAVPLWFLEVLRLVWCPSTAGDRLP